MSDPKSSSTSMSFKDMDIKKMRLFRRMSIPILVFTIIFVIWFFKNGYYAPSHQPNSYCQAITEWTYIDEDGNDATAVCPFHIKGAPRGVPFSFYTTLPDVIRPDSLISVLTSRHYQLYIDNELRYEYNPDVECTVPGGIVKRVHTFAPLRPEDAGKKAEYRFIDTHVDNTAIDGTCIGDSLGIYEYFVNKSSVYFSICLILIVFSVLTIFFSVILQIITTKPLGLLTMAVSVLMATIWLTLDNESFQLLFNVIYIDGTLSYMFCLLIPSPFLIFLNELQNHRHAKTFFILQLSNIIAYIVFLALHFSGALTFRYSTKYISAYLTVVILAAIISAFIDIKQGYISNYKHVATGFLAFAIFAIFDILRIVTQPGGTSMIFIPIGLFIYMFSSIIQAVVQLINDESNRQKALAASDAKTRFLANMSHEIRTPINSILGINEMILKEEDNPKILEYSSMIRNSGKTLLGLVNDVLDFSKIEAGKMEIVENEYDSSVFLHDLVEFMHDNSDKKSIESRFNISSSIPCKLKGDEVHLRQVLINIISNAFKYTHEGYVELTAYIYEGSDGKFHLSFSVKDSGMGIKEDEVESLFDAFTRADISKNRTIQGTGLGLSIVKQLTESMGGTITVKSKYGEGSVFTVDVPQEVIDSTPVGDSYTKVNVEDKKRFTVDFEAPDKRILVVDDTLPNLIVIKEFLKDTKIQLDTAKSGIKALEMTKQNQYDLIYMDHMMPIMDGIETFKKIKSDKNNPNTDTPVVILTANAIAGSRENYLKEGFSDYLSKPIEIRQLLEMTRKYVAPKQTS